MVLKIIKISFASFHLRGSDFISLSIQDDAKTYLIILEFKFSGKA